jgi:hypothetical protein
MKQLKVLLLAVMLLPFLAGAQTQQNSKKAHSAHAVKFHAKRDSLVRGVSFLAFKQSVPIFLDSNKILIAKRSWRLWKHEKWRQLEHYFTVDSLNSGWPPNWGAITLRIVTLDTAILIDRYGGYYTADSVFHDKGQFVCKKGVPFPKRALPASTLKSPYRLYKIIKPIPVVKRGQIIPWFNEPGLGIQYQLPYTIDDLKSGGYIGKSATHSKNDRTLH